MVVLLPKDRSPAELAAFLSENDLDFDWEPANVDLTMPSFEFEGDVKLNEPLKELGMPTAFKPPFVPSEDLADFSGITGFQELYISGAFHKTFIAVDEEGAEAAAATAIVFTTTSGARSAEAGCLYRRPALPLLDRAFINR